MHSPGGIYLGEAYTVALPMERVRRIFTTLARGLYLAYTGQLMPEGVVYNINRPRDLDVVLKSIHELMDGGAVYTQVGDGHVFRCIYGVVGDRPDLSIWIMVFYDGVVFTVDTYNPTLERAG